MSRCLPFFLILAVLAPPSSAFRDPKRLHGPRSAKAVRFKSKAPRKTRRPARPVQPRQP